VLIFTFLFTDIEGSTSMLDACAKTADAISRRCPGVYLLTTSREPLGIGGETIYRVPSLSLPGPDDADSPGSGDAVALFVQRAQEQGVDLLSDERLLIDAPSMLCSVYFVTGEPGREVPLGQEAVVRARQFGDDMLLGQCLMCYLLFGDLIELDLSTRLLAEAIACTERSGDQLFNSFVHRHEDRQASVMPSSAWRASPRTKATGAGPRRCTASRRPSWTGPASRGRISRRYRNQSLADVRGPPRR
jgi:hypothetical protein